MVRPSPLLIRGLGLGLVCLGLVAQPAVGEEPPAAIASEDREFFERDVRPLLVKRCFQCHGGGEADGGLSLASAKGWKTGGDSGPAIVPGQPEKSLLIEAIHHRSLRMPPAEAGGQLPEDEIAILTKWVAIGAPDPRVGEEVLGGMTLREAEAWWAFQPLPAPPAAELAADARQIDEWLCRERERRELRSAAAADRRTLIRRLTYGLTGLPPTPEQVDAFVAAPSTESVAETIERLLDSPQYGVHWGRRWLDVVRYADTAGENTDRPLPHAWRYRNWVFDAFQRDLPFDQFVRLQLAGDLLNRDASPSEFADGIIATGYLAIARRFGHDIDKDMFLTYEDVIDNLGKSFLGLTIGCARCHDHKYDPVSAEDYYALYGIFASTRFAFPGCEPIGQPRDLVPLLPPSDVEALMGNWREQSAQWEAARERHRQATQAAGSALAKISASNTRLLVAGPVAEGASVPFEQAVAIKRGEVLQLTVLPNDSHGADSTRIEWRIIEQGGEGRVWNVADLVPDLLAGNPAPARDGGTWCFLETTSVPAFLTDPSESLEGHDGLKSWSVDSLPSVFVNSTDQPVSVWTTLDARSFFVHPGPQRPVTVAWVSPLDGEITLSGRVADAHPAGGDGVAFELTHIAAADFGPALVELGASTKPLGEPPAQPVLPVAYAVVDAEPKNARVHERGEPEKLGAEVPRRWLSVFGGEPVPDAAGSGRRDLADRIALHPLAARVMVNRIWQWHFGQGLVRSPNDFGTRGEPPSHPELLDFLAARFVQSGYSVKAMHRLILRTDAYQRASARPADDDPENRWLAHFSRRRLTAEELRDSLLMASGQLDVAAGTSHPFPAESSWTFTQHQPFAAVYETNRRSAFLMVQRQRRHPFLALFDGADPNASTPKRQSTTVPTQALYFINDPFFHAQAAAVAAIILEITAPDARLPQLHRRLFQRDPTQAERQRCQAFLDHYPGDERERWSALARVLLASNEFLFVE